VANGIRRLGGAQGLGLGAQVRSVRDVSHYGQQHSQQAGVSSGARTRLSLCAAVTFVAARQNRPRRASLETRVVGRPHQRI
jgi:hypothetical protein